VSDILHLNLRFSHFCDSVDVHSFRRASYVNPVSIQIRQSVVRPVLSISSVFVNGRSRPAIMENMRSRIDRGDIKAERQEAIKAMCDIAADRVSKLQA
jgi:hypothetical protein